MHGITQLFLGALGAVTALRLWLASRQMAALRAHRELVPEPFAGEVTPAEQRRAAEYGRARLRLGRSSALIDAALRFGLTLGGGLAALDALARRLAWPEPWQGTLTVLGVLLIMDFAALPFAAWRTFRIEAQFGFNRMSPALFAFDHLKQLLLGFALGAPLIALTLALMQRSPLRWWLAVWSVWLGAMLALSWAAPRFIAPWFNRFSALGDAPLRLRVEQLLERCGFAARGGVFVMDGSRRSAHGNAYFTGIGRSKRIVLFDTLLERLGADEIEAVLAHELGHFRLHHVRERLAAAALAAFAALALLAWLARRPAFYAALGVPQPSPAMALLLFMLVMPLLGFFATPLGSFWSRRHERAADDFAVTYSSASALARALIALYRDNATPLKPDRLYSAFYDSHPPALERIERLRPTAAAAR